VERHLAREVARHQELTTIMHHSQTKLTNSNQQWKQNKALMELNGKIPKLTSQLENAEKTELKCEERLRKARLAHAAAVRKRREVQNKRSKLSNAILAFKQKMGTAFLKLQASLVESKKLFAQSELNLEMLTGFQYYQELMNELLEEHQFVGGGSDGSAATPLMAVIAQANQHVRHA